jgi:hypothetical protein
MLSEKQMYPERGFAKIAHVQDCPNQAFSDWLWCQNRRGFSTITEIGKSYALRPEFSCG